MADLIHKMTTLELNTSCHAPAKYPIHFHGFLTYLNIVPVRNFSLGSKTRVWWRGEQTVYFHTEPIITKEANCNHASYKNKLVKVKALQTCSC